MFKKILIANRGEIALRIIWACRELGIQTVAIYSTADSDSLHVKFADEDICIGPPRNADSYLNIGAVIAAAEITDADAIHPGYGFLAESAHFAEVCEACRIRFIGPAPNMIRKISQRNSQITSLGGARRPKGRPSSKGQRKIAKNPVSKSWISHPYPYQSWPIWMKDR